MTIYLLIMIVYRGGTTTYEFKDESQCVNAAKAYIRQSSKYDVIAYCQEVRK